MPLHANSQFLVNSLHALPLLDGRFSNMTLVNYNSVADQRRGCFSLVFRARDETSQCDVALKFFDPQSLTDTYRLTAFRREHQILTNLLRVNRCLQLASGLNTYKMPVVASGLTITLPCEYFAIEWIEDEIDQYFLCQESFTALEKLILFDKIALSIATLHSKDVFHRDLKPDNIRRTKRAGLEIAIPIDLGTAARADSANLAPGYANPVGAGAYAAPEAHCRLAGNRVLGKFTDLYALGCLLFELFNRDLHIKAVISRNPNFTLLLLAMGSTIDFSRSDLEQKMAWDKQITRYSNSFTPSPINGAGSDVPPGIASLLNEILMSLTNIDYRLRPDILWVRRKVASAIKILTNEAAYQSRLIASRQKRQRRLDSIRVREERLENILAITS